MLDHDASDVLGRWGTDRGPQYLACDAWWHLVQNTLMSSEWGIPAMIENGTIPRQVLNQEYGHTLHFWDLAEGRHEQRVEFGREHQMIL